MERTSSFFTPKVWIAVSVAYLALAFIANIYALALITPVSILSFIPGWLVLLRQLAPYTRLYPKHFGWLSISVGAIILSALSSYIALYFAFSLLGFTLD